MARQIALGYSISYPGSLRLQAIRHGPYQQRGLISLNCVESWISGAVVLVVLTMPEISHGSRALDCPYTAC